MQKISFLLFMHVKGSRSERHRMLGECSLPSPNPMVLSAGSKVFGFETWNVSFVKGKSQ